MVEERHRLRNQLCSSIEESVRHLDSQIANLEAQRQEIEGKLLGFRNMREKKTENLHSIESSILADLQRRWSNEATILMSRLQIALLPPKASTPQVARLISARAPEGVVLSVVKEEAEQALAPSLPTIRVPEEPAAVSNMPTLRRRKQFNTDCLFGNCNKEGISASPPLSVSVCQPPDTATETNVNETTTSDWFKPSRVWDCFVNFVTEVSLTTSEAVEDIIV